MTVGPRFQFDPQCVPTALVDHVQGKCTDELLIALPDIRGIHHHEAEGTFIVAELLVADGNVGNRGSEDIGIEVDLTLTTQKVAIRAHAVQIVEHHGGGAEGPYVFNVNVSRH